MSSLMKVLVITLCMNICLMIFGLTTGVADPLNQFITVNNNTISPTSQFNLASGNSSIPLDPNTAMGSQTNVDNGSFIDSLRLVFNVLLILMIALFVPIYWGFALGLPLWLSLLLLIQTIVGIVALIMAIRGVGD